MTPRAPIITCGSLTLPPPLTLQLILKLKASMIDVRDSQSPNHLWQLCTAPGEDPWRATLSLGRLVANIMLSQAPRRRTKVRGGSCKIYGSQGGLERGGGGGGEGGGTERRPGGEFWCHRTPKM